jgi:hypothetical protein
VTEHPSCQACFMSRQVGGYGCRTHYPVYSLTAEHGDVLDGEDFQTLQVIRRTLLGLMEHGFIRELNTYSDSTSTQWSYIRGSEDPAQTMAGLVDTVKALAPDWDIEVEP